MRETLQTSLTALIACARRRILTTFLEQNPWREVKSKDETTRKEVQIVRDIIHFGSHFYTCFRYTRFLDVPRKYMKTPFDRTNTTPRIRTPPPSFSLFDNLAIPRLTQTLIPVVCRQERTRRRRALSCLARSWQNRSTALVLDRSAHKVQGHQVGRRKIIPSDCKFRTQVTLFTVTDQC